MSGSSPNFPGRVERSNECGPFDEGVIAELEQARGIKLPEDYLAYLRAHNGGQPVPGFYWVDRWDDGNPWGSGIETLYGAHRNKKGYSDYSLLRNDDGYSFSLKPGMLAIGDDGCGGHILMSTLPVDFGSIHFCCSWSDHPNGYEDDGYWRIADSFSDFLNRLEESPSH